MIKRIIIVLGLLSSYPLAAKDIVWIVGGGYDLKSSQAQIEKNVLWAVDAIKNTPISNGSREIKLFFTDGSNSDKDIKVWRPVDAKQSLLQPLAMIYDAGDENGLEYRNHEVPDVLASTKRSVLEPALEKSFSELQQGDRGLFVFNGHGSQDKTNSANNKIWLWDRTSLNVNDFSNLLNKVDNKVPMRFVFTQCYSGGFERAVHPNARDSIELVKAPRCGFFAEAADRKAEGCSSGVNIDDYRDYSTYFFAALSGKTRQGEALPEDPDRNKDGEVSLYEAHIYTLAQADSTDLPRSTSEVYLERWQPWYLRWFFAGEGRGNVYAKLANDIARELRVPTDQSVQRSVISKKRRRLDRRFKKLGQEHVKLRAAMTEVRFKIRYELEQRWPEAAKSRTDNYQRFINSQAAAVSKFIMSHDDWPKLIAGYQRYQEIATERLSIERELTRFDKLHRLNKLARLRQQFEQHATEKQKAGYQQLLGCEKLPL